MGYNFENYTAVSISCDKCGIWIKGKVLFFTAKEQGWHYEQSGLSICWFCPSCQKKITVAEMVSICKQKLIRVVPGKR